MTDGAKRAIFLGAILMSTGGIHLRAWGETRDAFQGFAGALSLACGFFVLLANLWPKPTSTEAPADDE